MNLVPGFFPVTPSATATATNINGRIATVTSESSTTIGIRTLDDAGASNDFSFNITVTRQGSDYRTPSKAIGLPQQRIAYIQDTSPAATSNGDSASGGWFAFPLNVLQDPTGVVTSLASNQFVLSRGVYDITAFAMLRRSSCQIRVRNITDGTTVIIGSNPYGSNATDSAIISSIAEGIFNITSSKTFELQYRVEIATTFGLGGMSANFGENVLNASVKLTKLEE